MRLIFDFLKVLAVLGLLCLLAYVVKAEETPLPPEMNEGDIAGCAARQLQHPDKKCWQMTFYLEAANGSIRWAHIGETYTGDSDKEVLETTKRVCLRWLKKVAERNESQKDRRAD